MASELSNHFKAEAYAAFLAAITVKGALMATGFVFNKDTHANWSDASASELAAGNGYTAGGQTLAGYAILEDDANDRADATWNSFSITATGGQVGPASGMMLFKDTGTPATSTVIGFIDFLTDQTANDTKAFDVTGITVRIA